MSGGGRIEVRTEAAGDRRRIRDVVARAFENAEHRAPAIEPDGVPGEATLVGWLRDSDAFDGRFALVAEVSRNGDIGSGLVGYVVATWGDVDGVAVLGIGPLAVDPHWQRHGVGSALMREVVARASAAGERVVLLLGDPAYYGRFGFVPASRLGIEADPAWGDFFQGLALGAGGEPADPAAYQGPRGTFTYAESFSRLG